MKRITPITDVNRPNARSVDMQRSRVQIPERQFYPRNVLISYQLIVMFVPKITLKGVKHSEKCANLLCCSELDKATSTPVYST